VSGGGRRRQVTPEEADLWRLVMRDTKRLHPDRDEPPPAAATPAPTKSGLAASAAARQAAAAGSPPVPVPSPCRTEIQWATTPAFDHRRSPGLDKRTAGRFAKGSLDIDAVIDLHGLTQAVAHAALFRFVLGSADLGRRCLLVITGKGNGRGTGVLKAEVPRWLNEPSLKPHILAVTRAQPKDGGDGALYVLLKRRR
jgi:DNA-nicking Smr family endonuclease